MKELQKIKKEETQEKIKTALPKMKALKNPRILNSVLGGAKAMWITIDYENCHQ